VPFPYTTRIRSCRVSFDRAARHLGVAQPSLHRCARDLERVLRRTLYQRTARGFTTTAQGAELARRFKVALREIEYGIEELHAAHGVVISRIALGNIPHSQTHLLSAAINEFSALYPDACVQVLDGHYEALLTRARVLAKLDDRTNAARDFTAALAMSSIPEPELYLERANVQPVDEALRGLDDGINKLGPVVTLQIAAIELELRRKNYDGALARLDQITAQSERKEAWLVKRGEILKLAGRDDEARAAFNAALVAIEALPPAYRQSRAVTALELRARSALK